MEKKRKKCASELFLQVCKEGPNYIFLLSSHLQANSCIFGYTKCENVPESIQYKYMICHSDQMCYPRENISIGYVKHVITPVNVEIFLYYI